jgi:hypothetical protein
MVHGRLSASPLCHRGSKRATLYGLFASLSTSFLVMLHRAGIRVDPNHLKATEPKQSMIEILGTGEDLKLDERRPWDFP